jgi:chemotaxis protein CheX
MQAQLEVDHVRPFIYQTINTFDLMIGARPQEMDMASKDGEAPTHEVSAFIGLSGSGIGGVVLSFPSSVACTVVSRMLDEEYTEVNQDVADGVGELVNIITGNAKRDLVKYGYRDLHVSLPHLIVGEHRTIWRSQDLPCLLTRFFTTDIGPFALEVNIRLNTQIEGQVT